MKIMVLDNYDSFTYNLVHYMEKVGDKKIDVFTNDSITIEQASKYDKILLSPGPGLPSESGIMPELILKLRDKKDILGICLGLQAIVESFGGKLFNSEKVFHGVALPVNILNDDLLFQNLPKKFSAGRYHSWVADRNNFPEELIITAEDDEKFIMGIAHKNLKLRAVQFHPESILSEYGEKIISNWIHS
jgi:anthranilate synthase component 2